MIQKYGDMAIRNLIEMFVKKSKVTRIFKISETVSKNIYDVFRPINVLSIIFGLRVFEIPSGHSRTILSWVYSMLLFGLSFAIWSFIDKTLDHSRKHYFSDTVEYVSAIINHIELFFIAIIGLYQSESFKLCVKKMHEIDKTLEMLVINAIAVIETKLLYSVKAFLSPEIYLSLTQYLYSFMVEFLMLIEFSTMIRCVESEFQRANQLLSDFNVLPISSIASELIGRSVPIDSNKLFNLSSSLRRTHSRLQVTSQKIKRSRKLLRTIRHVHLELCRLSKSFSKMYGIQMSLQIAMCILYNVQFLYHIYGLYLSNSDGINGMNFQLITAILVCLQYSIRIFAVNYMCDRTTEEAERTNEIIHTFYGKNTDLAIQKEVEIFSMQMMQCHTSYSAFGLYNFGCKHICSCIGVIVTYVVIIVQVTDSLKLES
ncbi:hypothetical protein M0802_011035 [Mischocyttarus mexicanus]|nr:hypothetical protein M0802_011035 [Mischocyttarus mexicanus]